MLGVFPCHTKRSTNHGETAMNVNVTKKINVKVTPLKMVKVTPRKMVHVKQERS